MTTKLTDCSENRRILVIDDNVLIHDDFDDFRKILQPGNEVQNLMKPVQQSLVVRHASSR